MPKDEMFFPMPNLAGLAIAAPAGDGDGGDAAPEAPKEEKTHFELKLVTFDAKAKIKIIKEVRAATKLGLKEVRQKHTHIHPPPPHNVAWPLSSRSLHAGHPPSHTIIRPRSWWRAPLQ